MNPVDLKFFTTESSDYPILAAVEDAGMYFSRNGQAYSDIPMESHGLHYQRRTGRLRNYNRITLSAALGGLTPEGRQRFLKKLKLSNPNIVITEEITQQIIFKLRENRAFNEDSAMPMNDNADICYSLSLKKLIKEFDGRFFIEQDLKNIKDLKDIPSNITLTQAVLNV